MIIAFLVRIAVRGGINLLGYAVTCILVEFGYTECKERLARDATCCGFFGAIVGTADKQERNWRRPQRGPKSDNLDEICLKRFVLVS